MNHGRLRELEWQRDDLWRKLDGLYREALAPRKTYGEVSRAVGAYRAGWREYDRACRELQRAL
jgi:hypothetical protein